MDCIGVCCSTAAMTDQPDDFKLTPAMLEMLRGVSTQSASDLKLTRYEPCLCGKLLDVIAWEVNWHSGRFCKGAMIAPGINYTDLLCEDCRKEFKNWPRIVCLGCRSLMGFYKPGKQATGFVFENGRHYHIASCPRCKPASHSTPVIEHEQFCQQHRIQTTTNPDLLQEIEQKTLQAKNEAAKLRAEYERSAKT